MESEEPFLHDLLELSGEFRGLDFEQSDICAWEQKERQGHIKQSHIRTSRVEEEASPRKKLSQALILDSIMNPGDRELDLDNRFSRYESFGDSDSDDSNSFLHKCITPPPAPPPPPVFPEWEVVTKT